MHRSPPAGDHVSIHASSREDATTISSSKYFLFMFQSTRPRGRTRHNLIWNEWFRDVSIHASSREDATCYPLITGNESIVSIHASSREDATNSPFYQSHDQSFNPRVLAGGRDTPRLFGHSPNRFQSTRPRGRTRPLAVCHNPRCLVSIHASSREDATVSVESNINQNVTFAKARRK